MTIPAPVQTTDTNVAPSPLQQLAAMFQRAGIQPNMQATNASIAPETQLPPDQSALSDGMQPPPQTRQQAAPGALANLATMYPDLAQSLGMGTQQSSGGQSPQTPDYQGILNLLNGTTVNGTDQVTAQPSFINSIARMLP